MQALRSSYTRPSTSITFYGYTQQTQHSMLALPRLVAARATPAVAAARLPQGSQQGAKPASQQALEPPAAHRAGPCLQAGPSLLFGQPAMSRTYARLPERGSTVPRSTVTNGARGASWREKAAGGCNSATHAILVDSTIFHGSDEALLAQAMCESHYCWPTRRLWRAFWCLQQMCCS